MRWAVWAAAGLLACGGSRETSAPADGGGSVGPADAGSPSDGGADGGVDAGGYSGPDCTGIAPASTGGGLTFDAPAGACSVTAGDGTGVIAALGGSPGGAFWEYDARGAQTGAFQSSIALPQASGFVGVVQSQSGKAIAAFDKYGNPAIGVPLASDAVVTPAWHGGAIAFSGGSALTAQVFDASANLLTTVSESGAFTALGGAQDAGGKLLALVGGVRGVWLDPSSGAAGAPFTVGSGSAVLARALAGGGVAVRLDGRWTATLQPGDPTLHPAPAWLRDGDDFSLVRGGKAYAIARGASVDFVSTLGNDCGSTAFTGQAAIAFGVDGTVIGSSGAGGCTKVFWPGLLK